MSDFNGMEIFFLVCAVAGGFLVAVKMVLQLFGGDLGADADSASALTDAQHADSDLGFKTLSIHGMASFLMMFGLVGLGLYRQSHLGFLISLAGGSLSGVATVWVIAKLFQLAGRMQSSGTLSAGGVLASTGMVYLTIPKGGTGRVTINVRNRLREFDAVGKDGEELPTGTPVQVLDMNGTVLVVHSIAPGH